MNRTGSPLAPNQLKKTWKNFRRINRNLRSKTAQKLVLHYLPLVQTVAANYTQKRKSKKHALDELASAGLDGLYNALHRYRSNRNCKFTTYAYYLVRGAIHHWIEKTRLPPRRRQHRIRQLSLDATDANETSLHHVLQAPPAPNHLENQKLRQRLRRSIRGLGPNAQIVLDAYYDEKLTMETIGKRLGITKQRVSQIHAAAVKTLRQRLKGPNDDPHPAAQRRV